MIYLDNAATTLRKPPAVAEAVVTALTTAGNAARGAHGASLNASRAVFETRQKLAALFGWNLIWFGVIINILVTMAGMTPPFGVSLFVAKELADVPLSLVYRSSIPFVLAFFLCLGFCIAFEPLSTWLPAMMR